MKLYKAGIVTLSDKGYRGLRTDQSGSMIRERLSEHMEVIVQTILPDEAGLLKDVLIDWCFSCDLILTTGGTGLGVRDITPEATLDIAEKIIPGISEGMRMEGMKQTPFAALSRGVSVMREQTLIINLPGNPKAVNENLDFLLPILPHTLDILTDKKTEH